MAVIKFEPVIIILYNILKKYDTYTEFIFGQEINKELNEYFNFYKSELFGEGKNKIEEKTKKQVLNSCLYIKKSIISKLVMEDDLQNLYLNIVIKINKYKTRLREQVATYLSKNNTTKYILSEYESNTDKDKKQFITTRLSKIKKWENDKDSLLSDFYYIDELQKNQFKLILEEESIYILLHDVFNYGNESLLDFLKNKKIKPEKKRGATVPNSMFEYESIFSVEKRTIKNVEYKQLENNEILVKLNKNSDDNLFIIVPNIATKYDGLDIEYNANTDAINFSPYDFKVLVALFEMGGEELLKGKERVSFNMEDLCLSLLIKPCGKNYDDLAKAIHSIRSKIIYSKVSDTHIRSFNVIKTLDFPILNSDRKKQWTVVFHEELVQEIVANKYKSILTKTIASLKLNASILLFKIVIYDINNNPNEVCFSYTWDELSSKLGLTDKPSRNKERLKLALKEMIEAPGSIISHYETTFNDSHFIIYPNMNRLKMISDL